MKIGVVYPQIETGGDPEAVGRIARAVEDLGYDHLLMYDHLLGAEHSGRAKPLLGPYTEKDPFHDPLVSFAYLAGITSRIELFTGVLILPQRQTVLVARQAADVSLLSGGRLRLGVGVGWNYVEYDALGIGFETRGKRLDEQIGYLRRLWSEPVVSFEGRFDRVDRAALIPKPRHAIPILCGGASDAAYRRAVRLGDGFIFPGEVTASAIPALRRIEVLLAEAGRPREGFATHALLQSETYGGLPIDAAVDALRRWQDAGGETASIVTMGLGLETVQAHIDFIAEVRHRIDG